MNIGVSQAATVLSTMIDAPVGLTIPQVTFVELETLRSYLDTYYHDWGSCVVLSFSGGLSGDGVLVFSLDSAKHLISLVGHNQFAGELLPEMESDLLLELGNIIINSCVGAIANLLEAETTDGFPQFCSRGSSDIFDDILEKNKEDSFGMIITTDMRIENTHFGLDLIICFEKASVNFVVDRLISLVE
jgi:chemotaxis protein CheC